MRRRGVWSDTVGALREVARRPRFLTALEQLA
jgi:hypothetical protein